LVPSLSTLLALLPLMKSLALAGEAGDIVTRPHLNPS
jgi:hypothetical protein